MTRCELNQKRFYHCHYKNNALNSTMLIAIADCFPLFRFHVVSQLSRLLNNVKYNTNWPQQ